MNHVKTRWNEGWRIESNDVGRDETDWIEPRLWLVNFRNFFYNLIIKNPVKRWASNLSWKAGYYNYWKFIKLQGRWNQAYDG